MVFLLKAVCSHQHSNLFGPFKVVSPSDVSWFIKPYEHYRYITNRNHSEIGVMLVTCQAGKWQHVIQLLDQVTDLNSPDFWGKTDQDEELWDFLVLIYH